MWDDRCGHPTFLYNSRTDHLDIGVPVQSRLVRERSIPHGELTGGDASLRLVEEDIQAVRTHDERGILKRLTVAYAHAVTTDLPYRHLHILTYPVDFRRIDTQAAAGKSLMGMSLAYIYYIIRNVSLDDKDGILVSADVQTLSLTYCIELGSVVFSDNLSVWIFLIAGLLYVLPSAPVGLGLELYVVSYRF